MGDLRRTDERMGRRESGVPSPMEFMMRTALRKTMGWLTVGLLSFIFVTPGWALDVDRKVAQLNADSAQITTTLGRDKMTTFSCKSGKSKKSKKVSFRNYRKGKKKKIYYVFFKSTAKKSKSS